MDVKLPLLGCVLTQKSASSSHLLRGRGLKSRIFFTVFLFDIRTVHLDIIRVVELFHQPTLMHSFLYSLTICLLHYFPRHVWSINMPIFRRKNCIHTASGIFALCKRLYSTPVESRLQSSRG